jgi:tRNA(Ile)-lysidine synthase
MRAKRLPLCQREKQPVFLSGEEIVWILGFPVSERFKVNEGTGEIFVIERL